MATVDLTVNTKGGYPVDTKIISKVYDAQVNPASAADVIQLLPIGAKTFVHKVFVEVIRAEGGTFTFDVGDADDPNGFLATVNGNTTGTSISTLALTEGTPNTVTGYFGGKYYSADDTIDIVLGHNVDNVKLKVSALITYFG